MKSFTFIIALLFFSVGYSQNTENLKAINQDIWSPFSKAFETSDYELFGSLHSEDLIRISADGRRVLNKEAYIQGYETNWANTNQKRKISFRFLERLSSNDMASERGIYKLTINPNTDQEMSYYGKFHVILKKESGSWIILVDYDSSEGQTINENSYNAAFAIDDFGKY